MQKRLRTLNIQNNKNKIVSKIQLNDIYYAFDPSQPNIIRDLNVTIPAGQFIGIVGPSGVGKTTLIDLLLGLHRPRVGKILMMVKNLPISTLQIGNHKSTCASRCLCCKHDNI